MFYTLHIVVPLLAGLYLYLTLRPDAYVSLFVSRFLPLPAPAAPRLPEWLSSFLRNHAADMLWAYALGFAVQSVLGYSRRKLLVSSLLCVCFEILVELSQRFGVLQGTFDPLDAVLEALSVCLAMLVINLFEEAHNEKKRKSS